MKRAVRMMSAVTTVWTVVIIVIIVLMMLPVIPGVVTVKMPASEDWTTTVTNDTVSMSSNISLRNGGLFPFRDLYFVISLYGDNATPLFEFSSDHIDLQPNTWVEIPISVTINRSAIGESRLRTMVFDRLVLDGLIYFNTRYLLDFRAQLGLSANLSLGPLINAPDLHLDRSTASLVGDSASLNIPFSLNSSRLEGRNITISGTISNSTQEIGSFDNGQVTGQNVEENLTVNLTREAYDHLIASPERLSFNVTLTVDDLVWNFQTERDWQPPPGG
ncbi:MAG: hypothetical protein ISF22_04355 [Methanomassiliicoccus sp.]|nr:hypothetical protein [Methanomassiliicoccus sp.]